MFRGMDMNDKKISGEITGGEISGKEMIGTTVNNTSEETTGTNRTGNSMPSKKKFPIGWLLLVAALSFLLGHFWSYVPFVRGIVSLFVLSRILTGTAPGAFLL